MCSYQVPPHPKKGGDTLLSDVLDFLKSNMQMEEWVWSNGGMIPTGENWSNGRKTYTVWVVGGWMSMEQWWNDTDRGKLKYWEKNIIQRGW